MEKKEALFIVGSAMTSAGIAAVARLVEGGHVSTAQAEKIMEDRLNALAGNSASEADAPTEKKAPAKRRGRPKKADAEAEADVEKEPQITLDEIRENYLNKAVELGVDRDALLDMMEEVAGTRKLPAVDVKHFAELVSRIDGMMREQKAINDANTEAAAKDGDNW